jgi:leader peptidase (prepilin peptidase)/N-methyltransferase
MDSLIASIDQLGWIFDVWLFALGAAIGSFLNVVVYRLPRGKSIVYPGSQCPTCGHAIRWYHNLPIVSWIWLHGKCHDCGAKISIRYPLIELATGLLFVAARIVFWPR